jgi:hypothetical protein
MVGVLLGGAQPRKIFLSLQGEKFRDKRGGAPSRCGKGDRPFLHPDMGQRNREHLRRQIPTQALGPFHDAGPFPEEVLLET